MTKQAWSPCLQEGKPRVDSQAKVSRAPEAVWLRGNRGHDASWPPATDGKPIRVGAAHGDRLELATLAMEKLRLFALATTNSGKPSREARQDRSSIPFALFGHKTDFSYKLVKPLLPLLRSCGVHMVWGFPAPDKASEDAVTSSCHIWG